MTNKTKIGVMLGGRSGEHEVSLMSARSVLAVMDPEKYEITQIGITHDGEWWSGENVLEMFERGKTDNLYRVLLLAEPGNTILYKREGIDGEERISPIAELEVIFPVLHGTFGEDGTLQGLLEMADFAYVGAGVLGSSVGMDKGIFKDVMIANQIPVADWIIASRNDLAATIDQIVERAEKLAPYPLFVKPANLGSSVGITKCKNRSDLVEGMLDAARYDRRILIERGINAREIEISVLGNEMIQVSLPGEIKPSDEFYSYKAKYLDDRSQTIVPADLPKDVVQQIQETAIRVYQAVDCAGMARVDFLWDQDNQTLYVNELNTIPGFTSISMYPKLWEASGISYPELIDQLIQLGIQRKQERSKTKRTYGD